jgi:hypothetical protein
LSTASANARNRLRFCNARVWIAMRTQTAITTNQAKNPMGEATIKQSASAPTAINTLPANRNALPTGSGTATESDLANDMANTSVMPITTTMVAPVSST